MKTLSDGFEVSARSYYFLLDWNEVNEGQFMAEEFGKACLKDLTRDEYKRLFIKASLTEINKL